MTYLRIVAPFYGFFGLGMALYFASQGTGNMVLPFTAGVIRLALARRVPKARRGRYEPPYPTALMMQQDTPLAPPSDE